MSEKRFLILSDGKPGHVNQSIAFARHLGCDYDLVPVSFPARCLKAASYLADCFGIYSEKLFCTEVTESNYNAVVSAGSETYYANKTVAKQLGLKAIAIMLPKGYRYNFDLIVAQQHDNPPAKPNILNLPINLTYVEPLGIVQPVAEGKYISFVIGGESAHGTLDAALLRKQIQQIFALFPDHRKWMTTSRRTPAKVEEMLREFQFERAVYFSQEPVNPIPDFLEYSEYVFLTADSSSMISEAVSFGSACVEVLPLKDRESGHGKFFHLLSGLERQGCLHLFAGSAGCTRNKIDLSSLLKGLRL